MGSAMSAHILRAYDCHFTISLNKKVCKNYKTFNLNESGTAELQRMFLYRQI
jgi:hypothetical protein